MKKLSSILLMSLCGLVFTTVIYAQEIANQEHILVGVRAESIEMQIEHENVRTALAENDIHGKGVSAQKSESKKGQRAKVVSSKLASQLLAKSLYYTMHPGAYHNPVSISIFGDTLEIEDGSIWAISSSDAYTTLNWFSTDLIVITPNHSWFSAYNFRLTNQNTGESVAANLYLGPFYNSPYTRWIASIDHYSHTVYLNDGSAWSMSSFDASIVNKWFINDTVIIGVNDGWLYSTSPNILINVNMLNYAVGLPLF